MSFTPATQAATVTAVACSTTVATLLAAGTTARRMVLITNATASSILYIKFGPNASSTDFTVRLAAGGYYEMPAPIYGGVITGILDTGTGNAQITTY